MLSTAGVEVSLVVPAFNEAGRLERALPRLLAAIDQATTEVVVVDDGSSDATTSVARDHLRGLPHSRVLQLPVNAGKGGATRIGIARARGRSVAFMDADVATDPAGIGPLLAALRDAEVAVGSRAHPDSVVEGASPARTVMGRGFNALSRLACGFGHRDTQCGFKAFRAPAAKVLFHLSRVNGFAFDVELLMLAHRLGLRVTEVPVHWTAVPGSTVRPVRDPLPMALDVVRSRVRWRGGRPLAALTAVAGRGDASEVAAALRANLRRVDPVATWDQGAFALLPCTDRSRVARVLSRLERRLPECRVGAIELEPPVLDAAPGGLVRSALAA